MIKICIFNVLICLIVNKGLLQLSSIMILEFIVFTVTDCGFNATLLLYYICYEGRGRDARQAAPVNMQINIISIIYSFKLEVMSLNILFSPTNSQNVKDIKIFMT